MFEKPSHLAFSTTLLKFKNQESTKRFEQTTLSKSTQALVFSNQALNL